jgi:hypothetical protein
MRVLIRCARRPSGPRDKLSTDEDHTRIEVDHAEPPVALSLMCDTLPAGDAHLADGLLSQPANVTRIGRGLTTRDLRATVGTVHGLEFRDPIEALLPAQGRGSRGRRACSPPGQPRRHD